LQVGDTGPVESARRSNSRVLGSPFSGLSGQGHPIRRNSTQSERQTKEDVFFSNTSGEVLINVRFSTLLHLPPLKFHWAVDAG
jgi:hypothetical protein